MSRNKNKRAAKPLANLPAELGAEPMESVESFSFGDAITVNRMSDLNDCFECANNGLWYETPISTYGLARMLDNAAYHSSPLFFKRNVILSCYIPHPLLSRQDMSAWILDYLIFGNNFMEVRRNRLGEPIELKHSLAKYTRRGVNLDQYWFVTRYAQDFAFEPGSVCQIKNPSIHQEIYGSPEYMAALNSVSLNGEATVFRRNYYINGSHAGVIVYLTDPVANNADVEKLKRSLKEARGNGAFKNLFVYAAGGKKDGLQILPFSQIAAKDEFTGIKDATRDDMLAIHRVPPQLMGVMPGNVGGFGDVEKAAQVFSVNELLPIQETLKELNSWLGIEVIRFNEYALAKKPAA